MHVRVPPAWSWRWSSVNSHGGASSTWHRMAEVRCLSHEHVGPASRGSSHSTGFHQENRILQPTSQLCRRGCPATGIILLSNHRLPRTAVFDDVHCLVTLVRALCTAHGAPAFPRGWLVLCSRTDCRPSNKISEWTGGCGCPSSYAFDRAVLLSISPYGLVDWVLFPCFSCCFCTDPGKALELVIINMPGK